MTDKQFNDIQKQVMDYFEGVDDSTFVKIVNSFVYFKSSNDKKVSELISMFLKDNGIESTYLNFYQDKTNPNIYFNRCGLVDAEMISNIQVAFLNASFNRFGLSVDLNKNEESKKERKNKKKFNYLKTTALECYESLNRSEHYFYGEKEDAKIVNKIMKMNYE